MENLYIGNGRNRLAVGTSKLKPFNPSQLNPDVWFDPSDASTVFVDRAGTVPAMAGDPVGQIKDKSGKGNHAVAPTDAARSTRTRMPKTGRRNLLTYTEDLLNPIWEVTNIARTAGFLAPDGSMGACKLSAITTSTEAQRTTTRISQGYNKQPFGSIDKNINSIYVKAGSYKFARLSLTTSANAMQSLTVNLETGEVITPSLNQNYSITAAGNGWYRISAGFTGVVTLKCFALFLTSYAANADAGASDPTNTPQAGEYIYVYQPQFEGGISLTPYQKVTNAFDVTEAGVPDVWGLLSDGVDDKLVTDFIDFSHTQQLTMFIGVEIIANRAPMMLVEFGYNHTAGNLYITRELSAQTFVTNISTNSGGTYASKRIDNAPVGKYVIGVVADTSEPIANVRNISYLNGDNSVAIPANNSLNQNEYFQNRRLSLFARTGVNGDTTALPSQNMFYGLVLMDRKPSNSELVNINKFLMQKAGIEL